MGPGGFWDRVTAAICNATGMPHNELPKSPSGGSKNPVNEREKNTYEKEFGIPWTMIGGQGQENSTAKHIGNEESIDLLMGANPKAGSFSKSDADLAKGLNKLGKAFGIVKEAAGDNPETKETNSRGETYTDTVDEMRVLGIRTIELEVKDRNTDTVVGWKFLQIFNGDTTIASEINK